MKQSISNPTNACINLMYFFTNFPSNFIQKCWEDEPIIIDHLKTKFNSFCEQYGSNVGIHKLFYELDRDNQLKLIDWINENYTSFSDLLDAEPITFKYLLDNLDTEKIEKCWEGETNLNFIKEKFNYFKTLTVNKEINIDSFFYSLDSIEKDKLVKWLTENKTK